MSLVLCAFALLTGSAGEVPRLGEPAPDFTLGDQRGTATTLSTWRGKSSVLVVFYGNGSVADDVVVLKALREEAEPSGRAANTIVLAIGGDARESREKLAASLGLSFPLLGDERHEVADRYGVVSGSGDTRVIQRAAFLIDAEGKLAYAESPLHVNASLAGSPLMKEMEKLAAKPRRVTFESAGGVAIAATLYPVAGATKPTALLFPGMRFERKVWDAFALKLQASGLPALAVDLRGQGESNHVGGKEVKAPEMLAKDPAFAQGMVSDARRAAQWLGEQGLAENGLVFIGSSLGANIALIAACDDVRARAALLMSPGLDYAGLQSLPAVQKMGERPLLIVCGQEPARADAEQLKAAAPRAELLERDQAAHGTALFERDEELPGVLLSWVLKNAGP